MKKRHSKVKTNEEFDRAKQWKDSLSAFVYCIRKSVEDQIRKSKSSEYASSEVQYNRKNLLFAVTWATSATDPLKTYTHQATQIGILIKLGLLKSGNLMNWWMIERWVPLFALEGERINLSLKTTKQNQNYRKNPDHSCTGWMIKCERDKNNLRWMLQKTTKNVLWYGECSCLQHCKHLYSWTERITQTIDIPSKIQKISQWNRCSTYLKIGVRTIRWDLWSEVN